MNIADFLWELTSGSKARINSWEKGDWISLRGDGSCFLDSDGNEYGLEILGDAGLEEWEVFDEERQERINAIIHEINELEVDASNIENNIDVLMSDLEDINYQIDDLKEELDELE